MKYNFDEVIDRKGTHAMKVERLPKGADKDSLALWVADMDFACAEPILRLSMSGSTGRSLAIPCTMRTSAWML